MDAPRLIGVLGTAPPLLSIFLSEIKIHVTTNTTEKREYRRTREEKYY
jgi:hypothetical protein